VTDSSSAAQQAAIDLAIRLAMDYRHRAYSPYSGFRVGAVIVSVDGTKFGGCNVENGSFSLTNCAERVAIQSAVAAGATQFSYLVLCSDGGVAPCGACLQVLAEFAPQLDLILVDAKHPKNRRNLNLRQLLPAPFSGPSISELG
jgi:cytidine deaminase